MKKPEQTIPKDFLESKQKNLRESIMELTFNEYQPHSITHKLGDQLDEIVRTDCLEEIIEFNAGAATGHIRSFDFVDGIGLMLFDCILKEDTLLNFNSSQASPVQLLFCVEGQITHQMQCANIRYVLNPLQGTITAGVQSKYQYIILPSQRKLLFALVSIDRKKYLEKIDCIIDQMPDALRKVFTDTKATQPFFYQGNYSVNSSSCIKKIVSDENSGLVRSTFVEAKVLELLSLQVKQFKDDLQHPDRQITIRDYDLEKIKYARDLLIKDIQNPPIIKDLAKLAGINQQKLKKGFKIVFDSTINNYLKNERLELAATLLMKNIAVKEAANAVGYTNQGHFAKRFKEKYGVLPKDYLKKVNTKLRDRTSANIPKRSR